LNNVRALRDKIYGNNNEKFNYDRALDEYQELCEIDNIKNE